MTFWIPRGFRLAGVHCGIKTNPAKPDVALIVSKTPATAAGIYTQNRVFAAPVAFDRQRTPSAAVQVVVANSGNANACTGERGLRDAYQMAQHAADAVGVDQQQVLVLSTGVIGEYLPMEKIASGIDAAASRLDNDQAALSEAARGFLTTDRREKVVCRAVQLGDRDVRITGIAKGAGMIGPKMATMLAVLMTDAPLHPEAAQRMLQSIADASFNCISVEGHMSTNDTMLLLANGQAGGEPLGPAEQDRLQAKLLDASIELARMIPDDGEGASHLITIDVTGCASPEDARQIAETVANSALVKTAIAGADPNWGRIVSAAGYAGVQFDPNCIALTLNGVPLFQQGTPVEFDNAAVSKSIRENRETRIQLQLAEGNGSATFWTSDLTVDYVRINADYHT